MHDELPLNVERLPTLTEVLELGGEADGAQAWAHRVPFAVPVLHQEVALADARLPLARLQEQPWPRFGSEAPTLPAPEPVPAAVEAAAATALAGERVQPRGPLLDEAAIVEQVLLALQPRIDTLLEARVSDALAPALARAADALIRESRDELFAALRGLAEESLAQVLRKNGLDRTR